MSRTLTQTELERLTAADWRDRLADAPGLWVSVSDQRVLLIQGEQVLFEAPCSTARNGVGCEEGSYKTPVGWHLINAKIGADAPWGQVFRAREATPEIWQPDRETPDDLILTRILTLRGVQPGINLGGTHDTLARYIYIHGTNWEQDIGRPVSHGCIRMRNDDIIALFDQVEEETPVLITP